MKVLGGFLTATQAVDVSAAPRDVFKSVIWIGSSGHPLFYVIVRSFNPLFHHAPAPSLRTHLPEK